MLKKLLFTTVFVIGCSLAAFGQSSDDKKQTPPKEKPPVIKVEPKPTPTPTPKKPNLVELSVEAKAVITI